MISRTLARCCSLLFAVAGLGCVATTDASQEELGKVSQELFYIPIIPYLPPSWVQACPADSPAGERVPVRFFVRRSGACDPVSRASGSWIGGKTFPDGGPFCSYVWRGTTSATPSTSDYWALDAMGDAVPASTIEMTNPKVIPNCAASFCASTSFACVTLSPTIPTCSAGEPCTTKIVNPCGTCGTVGTTHLNVVVPYAWIRKKFEVQGWPKVAFGPPYSQVFRIDVPSGVWVDTGDNVVLGPNAN